MAEADAFPSMQDMVARDPATGEVLVRCTAVPVSRLDSVKSDIEDRYPGADFEITEHVPDLLDIPTFLRRT